MSVRRAGAPALAAAVVIATVILAAAIALVPRDARKQSLAEARAAGSGPAPGADTAGISSAGPDNDRRLRRVLRRSLREAGGASGAWVVNATRRRELFGRHERVRRSLGSNAKLFTAAVTLRRLGPQAKLATTVVGRPSRLRDATLHGDLHLRGGGDPTLDGAALARLARELADGRGIKRVTGRIVGDGRAFDSRRGTAATDYGTSSEIGSLSALGMRGVVSLDPAVHAAARLDDALEDEGVRVDGAPAAGDAPTGRVVLAAVRSPRVSELVRRILKSSTNFHAEMLAKAIARKRGRVGSTRRALREVSTFARRLGSSPDLADGAGLSLDSRASPRSVGKLLLAMRTLPEFDAFHAALPIAGRDGTLRRRMRGGRAQGRCRAKTGTRVDVSALSGYCRAASGDTIVFSLLFNRVEPARAKRFEDRMVATIARLG